ncbi:MAG: hypothetical protein Tsb009_09360 [Planctomycetaceae bacterium]
MKHHLPKHWKITHDPREHSRKCHAGFTLFELLIVISLLAILAAVAVPTFRAAETQSLESTARSIAADLRLARELSIQHNTNYTVTFNTAINAYEITHTGTGTPPLLRNPSASHTADAGTYRVFLNQQGLTQDQPSSIRLVRVSLARTNQTTNSVTFGPLGGTGPTRSEDTEIWLASGDGQTLQTIKIVVSWVTGQAWVDRGKTP